MPEQGSHRASFDFQIHKVCSRPVVPGCAQILADQLTLFQPGGTDYAHLIATGTPGFSDLPMALSQGERGPPKESKSL